MIPKALLDEPILSGTSAEIAQAFEILSARRTMGMAPNPIQLSEICAFIELLGPPSIPLDLFVGLLGQMDTKYLELIDDGKPSGSS